MCARPGRGWEGRGWCGQVIATDDRIKRPAAIILQQRGWFLANTGGGRRSVSEERVFLGAVAPAGNDDGQLRRMRMRLCPRPFDHPAWRRKGSPWSSSYWCTTSGPFLSIGPAVSLGGAQPEYRVRAPRGQRTNRASLGRHGGGDRQVVPQGFDGGKASRVHALVQRYPRAHAQGLAICVWTGVAPAAQVILILSRQ